MARPSKFNPVNVLLIELLIGGPRVRMRGATENRTQTPRFLNC